MTFEEFWARFPRKVAKGHARRMFARVPPEKHAAIEAALAIQVPAFLRRDRDKVPHPGSWLNAERWDDDPAEYAEAPPAAERAPTLRGMPPTSPYCNWHVRPGTNGKRSIRPSTSCPECRHIEAGSARRTSEAEAWKEPDWMKAPPEWTPDQLAELKRAK